MYQSAKKSRWEDFVFEEMLAFAIGLGMSLGWISQSHSLGYAILEGIGIVVLVELLIWAVLTLAITEDFYGLSKSVVVEGIILFVAYVGTLSFFAAGVDWREFFLGNGVLASIFLIFLFVFRGDNQRTLHTQIVFGATLLGYNVIWAALYHHSFFYAAVASVVVIEVVRFAASLMNKTNSR